MPREARSVQISRRGSCASSSLSRVKSSMALLRCSGGMAPWKVCTSKRLPRRSRRRSPFSTRRHEAMVLQKMSVCSLGSASSSLSSASTFKLALSSTSPPSVPPLPPCEQSTSFSRTPCRVVCRPGPLTSLTSGKSRLIACSTYGGSVAVTNAWAARGGIMRRMSAHSASKSTSSYKMSTSSSTTRCTADSEKDGVSAIRCACSRPGVAMSSSRPLSAHRRCVAHLCSPVIIVERNGTPPAARPFATLRTCWASSLVGTKTNARICPA
mmetsp:Transcript_7213/g.15739  ORF Transcript_7213/g.15739 Transcript_7213/m.15739 type:complete len:268 (+) Transcript_7213:470-1273(+)